MDDFDKVFHTIVAQGGSPDNFKQHILEQYQKILKASGSFEQTDELMEEWFLWLWDTVKEDVWQTVDRAELSGEVFLKNHMCHTDEIWYAEDAEGNPDGSKPRCQDCVSTVDSLNRIEEYAKY